MTKEEIEVLKQQLKLQGSFFADKAIKAIECLQSEITSLNKEGFENRLELLQIKYKLLMSQLFLGIMKEEKLNTTLVNYQGNRVEMNNGFKVDVMDNYKLN